MTLGIFVEGRSDRDTIPILIGKLTQSPVEARVVPQGDMLDIESMTRQIAAMKASASRLTRIIIFRDSEGVDPASTYSKTTQPSAELNRRSPRCPVTYVIVDHSLEGWLLHDLNAVKAVVGANARVSLRGNPEDNPRPARLLARIFNANRQDYVKTKHNPKIAQLADKRAIIAGSWSFKRLATLPRGS